MFDLENIFSKFEVKSDFVQAKELDSGHINDTFLIETTCKPFYVLQRVNHKVFKSPEKVIANKFAVSEHLRSKLYPLSESDLQRKILTFVKTKNQENYLKDTAGNFWNLMIYIEDCISFEKVPNRQIAFEAGRIFSEFLYLTEDFDSTKLYKALPNFHSMSFRLKQFDEAYESASQNRKESAESLISIVEKHRNEMQRIEKLIAEDKIQIRLTHNDTKISNALFSKDEKALCVIDTDTVMPGAIHYDFGDAVRTICNTAFEDEKDLAKVNFNYSFYKAFVNGFLNTPIREKLSKIEVENLAFSAKMMTFIIALRFLNDFLNNDIYYKTSYENHNLDRAKNQFKLFDEMNKLSEEMEEAIKSELLIK